MLDEWVGSPEYNSILAGHYSDREFNMAQVSLCPNPRYMGSGVGPGRTDPRLGEPGGSCKRSGENICFEFERAGYLKSPVNARRGRLGFAQFRGVTSRMSRTNRGAAIQ